MKGQLSIDTIFAFVARDEDGTEGICGCLTPNGWMPLVGADMEKMKQLQPQAQMMVNATGKTIELVHFKQREHITTIEPNRLNPQIGVKLTDDIIGIV